MSEFVSQTELGKIFGVSSHEIGKWLVEAGLRTPEKRPSTFAFERGFVERAPTGRGSGYFYVWHTQKTTQRLEVAGHSLRVSLKPMLSGPFKARKSSEAGFEIVDGNGNVVIWCHGESVARTVVWLLNGAVRHGIL